MGLITNMRSRMQVVMWTILVLFVTSMAIGGLVGGASITDIFGGRQGNEVGSLNGKPILFEDFNLENLDEKKFRKFKIPIERAQIEAIKIINNTTFWVTSEDEGIGSPYMYKIGVK